jgi:hypothetical protein
MVNVALFFRELSTIRLTFWDGADFTSSLDALSKLKALEKFIFLYEDPHALDHLKFMDQCVQKLPALKYVGNELKMYSCEFDNILSHNFQVYNEDKQRVRFGFERIAVDANIPKNCYLPNLQCIFLNDPIHSVTGIVRFANVTELGFVGRSDSSLEILSIMGNQLTTLHMCLPSVCVASIFNCCKKLKNLYMSVLEVETVEETWSSDSIMNLETFVFVAEERLTVPQMFLYRVMQAPMLKVLEIYNACTRRDESKQAISDVQNGMILQNLVKFRFDRMETDLNESMDDDYSAALVRILLECCAAYCPKLIEACLDGTNIARSFLDPELWRMELLL